MGLVATMDLRIKILDVYGDSGLVINHIKGEWDTRHPDLIPYKDYARRLLPFFKFNSITFLEMKIKWRMLWKLWLLCIK